MSDPTIETLLRLHVACAGSPESGFVGMDRVAPPWPVATDSVTEVLCVDYVHRTTPVGGDDDGLVAFMNELHRVLAPGGDARIVHPHARTDRAFCDPTASRLISDQTWWFFDAEWRARERIHRPTITADFEIVSLEAPLHLDWYQRANVAQAFALAHYWNVVGDLEVVLRARKLQPHEAGV